MADADQLACSVVICVRNGAGTLSAQLRALSNQTEAPPFEVILVDNGSTDSTVDVYRRWANGETGAVRDTKLVDASRRTGLAYARNRGAEAARSEILAYCDADDVVADHWVEGAYRALTIGGWPAVGGRILTLTESGPDPAVLMAGLDSIGPSEGADRVYPYFWGCSFALTKEAFLEAGGFDESLPPYGWDDVDIGIRLAHCGINIGYEPQMTVYYAPPSGIRSRMRRKFRSGTAQACVMARHPSVFSAHSPRRILISLPGLVLRAVTQTGRPETRLRRAAESLAISAGQLWGWAAWVGHGRLGPPQYFVRDWPDAHATGG